MKKKSNKMDLKESSLDLTKEVDLGGGDFSKVAGQRPKFRDLRSEWNLNKWQVAVWKWMKKVLMSCESRSSRLAN